MPYVVTKVPFILLYLFLLPLLVSLQLILFRSPFWLCWTSYGYNLSLLYISVLQTPWNNASYFIKCLKMFPYIINQSQASVTAFFLQPLHLAVRITTWRPGFVEGFCRALCIYPNGIFRLDAASSSSHLMPFTVGLLQKLYKINT